MLRQIKMVKNINWTSVHMKDKESREIYHNFRKEKHKPLVIRDLC